MSPVPPHKLSFPVQKSHVFLWNSTDITDSNPLTYLLKSAELDTTSTGSFLLPPPFSSNLLSKPESRTLSLKSSHLHHMGLLSQKGKTVGSFLTTFWEFKHYWNPSLVHMLSFHLSSLPDSYINDAPSAASVIPQLSVAEVAGKQRADPITRHVTAQLESLEASSVSVGSELPEMDSCLNKHARQ